MAPWGLPSPAGAGQELFNNPLYRPMGEHSTMSSAQQITAADAEAMVDDAHGGPPITADPTSFDDAVERAEWLEKVLRCTFEMEAQDAKMIAGCVIEQFGDKDEILDDEIPNDVRSVFYTLEAKRILTFRRIEYESEDGATLRGFFWRFHEDWEPPEGALGGDEDQENVYEALPEDCWSRDAAA